MVTAAEAAFGTAELLESILHKLPTKNLLLAQRVCKQWKQSIETSSKLQQALFFKSVNAGLLKYDASTSNWTTKDGKAYIIFLNPIFRRKRGVLSLSLTLPKNNARALWLRPEASWRRMLLTQPAVEMKYRLRHARSMVGDFEFGRPETKDGRMGVIFEEVDKGHYGLFPALHLYLTPGAELWEELMSNEQLEQI